MQRSSQLEIQLMQLGGLKRFRFQTLTSAIALQPEFSWNETRERN